MAAGSHRGQAGDDPGRLGGGRRARGRADQPTTSSTSSSATRARASARAPATSPRTRWRSRSTSSASARSGSAAITATDPAKPAAAEAAGRLVARRDRAGRAALVRSSRAQGSENAIVGVAGTGGSTNAVLHLLAIADEAGVQLELDDFDRLSASTPVVTSLTPGGRYVAGDLQRVGGTAAVMQAAAATPRCRRADGRRPHDRRASPRRAASPTAR